MLALRDSTEPLSASSDSSVYTTSSPALQLGKSLIVSSGSGTIKDVAHRSCWEFATGLHYEWDVIRGRQTYRWTIWIYLIARWATIAVVILIQISFNVTSPMNCQAWVWASWVSIRLALVTSYEILFLPDLLSLGFCLPGPGPRFAIARASHVSFRRFCATTTLPKHILMERFSFAVWNRNKAIGAIIAAIWVTNVSLLFMGVVRVNDRVHSFRVLPYHEQVRSVWDPLAKTCIVTNIDICEVSIISCFVADTILLLIMLAGLLRLRRHGRGSYELWDLLWKQGVIWFVVATVAELPPAVFMILNVNDVLDMISLFPSLVMTVIATTRMYRSLQCFAPPFS
ncbi:hypothetical protein BGY98DRAFT_1185140, partial [Russula aff. rugulosa BPL654]